MVSPLMIALIPLLPLIGFIVIALNVRRLSQTASAWIGCGVVLGSFALAIAAAMALPEGGAATIYTYFDWIKVEGFTASMSFMIDPLSIVMMLIITGVGFIIHVYSIGYMHDDPHFNRFFSYLNLFVFFMLMLVMGSNYLIMFVGWEGVGLCSYLLIGFWFRTDAYNDAANKAFIMNRIGDLGMLIGIILISIHFGSIEYSSVFANAGTVSVAIITTITLLLFVGATGKSAQIPLYTWLPDAMAGPTPVSALIHAATMVTAGIYMIARNNLLYAMSPISMEVVMFVGLATALFAATIAIAQNDIKKVLAYSTVSQLGLIFLALGLGAFSTGIFHMATHAFFKALLFLGAGSVIHALHGEQDIRNMGGLRKSIPVTFITFLIGVLAISGIPPFAGFFSKDEILAKAYEHHVIIWGLAVLVSALTALYMFRLLFLVFFGNARGAGQPHESPSTMTAPLIALAVFSSISGFVGMPEIFSSANFLGTFLRPVFEGSTPLIGREPLSHATEYTIMGAMLVITAIVIWSAYRRYVATAHVPPDEVKQSSVHRVVYNKYFIDELYHGVVVKPLHYLSGLFERFVEQMGIDRFVNGVGGVVILGSRTLRLFQTGRIGFYIFLMVLGIVSLLLISFLI